MNPVHPEHTCFQCDPIPFMDAVNPPMTAKDPSCSLTELLTGWLKMIQTQKQKT